MVQDVRYGLRTIRRNPAFATTVVMVLALVPNGCSAELTVQFIEVDL